ncbi:lysine-2,3-aminomutase-like protein [Beijerinckia indica]|uniref:Lysine 2,3-aminomutase YodO family protein n=1 Tax=Beijerinckia indica subsp. indica (strain ATCC 9039 / DSM 1715 / NCIMB 8712) TaxID=395963 RepID=B2ID18_BEII9|nr:lysine-2,3-aminomutase-like protein [Beijerinckia indica]ACB96783.1 lysine 2,3-aminomutase YodO family protein [Beijerinckia indica subsp. indica ATCC 9039]
MTFSPEEKMRPALRSTTDLVAAGLIPPEQERALAELEKTHAIGLTTIMADLINRNDPLDPIARQFLPDPREADRRPEELDDPIGDAAFSPVEGIVHRYPDRVLLKLLHICPVYCRFCFRRETVGPGSPMHLSPEALDAAFAYIASTPSIWEVILTGGDPLILSPRRLAELLERLDAIDHVKILRLHTRVPCVDPERITPDLVALLRGSRKTVYLALHANHPRELTPQARQACAAFIDAGIPMLSQSVLLRGVNDDASVLADLMRAFVETRIKPYYLHHPDLAPGTGHFRLSIAEGQALMRRLRGHLSGLCQPTYMLDLPGGFGKSPVGPNYLGAENDQGLRVEDYRGMMHAYPPKP